VTLSHVRLERNSGPRHPERSGQWTAPFLARGSHEHRPAQAAARASHRSFSRAERKEALCTRHFLAPIARTACSPPGMGGSISAAILTCPPRYGRATPAVSRGTNPPGRHTGARPVRQRSHSCSAPPDGGPCKGAIPPTADKDVVSGDETSARAPALDAPRCSHACPASLARGPSFAHSDERSRARRERAIPAPKAAPAGAPRQGFGWALRGFNSGRS